MGLRIWIIAEQEWNFQKKIFLDEKTNVCFSNLFSGRKVGFSAFNWILFRIFYSHLSAAIKLSYSESNDHSSFLWIFELNPVCHIRGWKIQKEIIGRLIYDSLDFNLRNGVFWKYRNFNQPYLASLLSFMIYNQLCREILENKKINFENVGFLAQKLYLPLCGEIKKI